MLKGQGPLILWSGHSPVREPRLLARRGPRSDDSPPHNQGKVREYITRWQEGRGNGHLKPHPRPWCRWPTSVWPGSPHQPRSYLFASSVPLGHHTQRQRWTSQAHRPGPAKQADPAPTPAKAGLLPVEISKARRQITRQSGPQPIAAHQLITQSLADVRKLLAPLSRIKPATDAVPETMLRQGGPPTADRSRPPSGEAGSKPGAK